MEESQPVQSLASKLAEVMLTIGSMEKKGFNAEFNYHFLRESDLVEALRGELAKRRVVLIPSVDSIELIDAGVSKSGNPKKLTRVTMTWSFIDGDTGNAIHSKFVGEAIDSGDKGVYKAYTGCQKYFLMKTFQVPTHDDPEATAVRKGPPASKDKPSQTSPHQRRYFAVLHQMVNGNVPGYPKEMLADDEFGKAARRTVVARLLGVAVPDLPKTLTAEDWRTLADRLTLEREEKLPVKAPDGHS